MSTQDSKLFPVYVWEVPVRIWHWVMALCMVVLAVTGYLIGTPLPTRSAARPASISCSATSASPTSPRPTCSP